MKHFYLRSAIARLCAVFCVGTLVQTGLFAQVALYSFSQTAGSYTPITGGTVVAAQTGSSGAASIDDVIYNLPNGTIPFSYNFNGTTYTGLNISSNGFVTFGATAPGTTNYNPISSTATYNSTIAAFARDLQGGFVTTGNVSSGSAVITGVTNTTYVTVGSGISGTGIPTGATVLSKTATDITISAAATSTAAATAVFVWNGEIRYETLGSAPNRVFVIQWANAKRFGTAATAQNGHISFQIRLYETTNVAEVVYANALGNATNITPAVGLRGSANTDFNDRTGANWPASTAGGTNSVTMTFDNVVSTTLPSNGLTYAWTPPVINDLAVAHTSPANISCFSGSENYTVTLTNSGNQPWNFATSNVTVSGAVTGPLVGNYNVVLSDNSLNGGSPLGVGASLVISLATLDLRAPGAYVFTGSHNASDANAGNNSSVANRTGNNPVAGLSSDAPVCDNAVLNLTSTATGGNNTITSSNSKTEAPALNIPDNSLTGVASTLSLAGPGSVAASSVITVGLNIPHTYNADLDIYLVGPGDCGTLELNSDNGVGSDGLNVTLTSSGNPSVTGIPTGVGVVTGNWNYEGSVTTVPAFNSGTGGGSYTLPAVALSGCPISGTWTLWTFDDANLDVGTVSSWSLSIAEGTPSGTYTHSYTGPGVFGPTSYSGAANSQGDVAVTGLTAGSQLYDVVVTDVNGCSSAPASHTALIQLSGCTDPIAVNFNALAICEDGSCLYGPAGDLTTDAISIGSAAYPSCSNSSHNLGGFYDSPESAASGPDKWLSLVAGTSAISIELNVDGPVEVELLSLSLVSVGSLSIPAAGTWNFNVTGLTAGDTYLLSLTDTGASGVNANVCSRYLPDSRCDYGSGPYTLCNTFKADWVGSVQYVFNFTSTTTANTYTKNNGTSTFCILSTVPGLTYGDTYDTRIDAIWNVGGTDITVIGDEICQVIVSAQPTTVLRPSDNCDNFGPHLLGQSIAAQPFVCGAINWKWEFTRTDVPELPITHYRGSSNRFLALTSVPGLVAGGTYDVRVAPVFSYGDGAFGSTDCITIVGAGGMMEMNDGVETIALVKIDNTTAATALVYPNPNHGDMINLSLENITDEVVTVDVIDMFGRVVFAQQYTIEGALNTVITFDNQLASGMYLLNVQTSAGMMTERIMVQH